ncbi:MAG: type II secretion system F family protein [Candidatus Binataceae bacterium]
MEILTSVALCVLLLGLGLGFYLNRRNEQRHLERTAGKRLSDAEAETLISSVAGRRESRAPAGPNRVIRVLERQLDEAGVALEPLTLLMAIVVLFAGGTALVWMRLPLQFALGGGAALGAAPTIYLKFRRSRRLKTLSRQLPYVLEMLKSALGAGHTLMRGLEMAASNTAPPLAGELGLLVDQVQLGMRLPLAFELMFRRVPIEELSFLAAAIGVQEETGSSLSEIIDRVAQSIRSRQRLADQINTLTSQSRLSAMIVSALPAAMLGVFYLIRPDYIHVLFTDPLGLRLLEIAIVLDTVAFFIMRRIAQVDF